MSDKFMPSEAKIADVIERTGGDPRKLAIAYLRAQKRAQVAELTSQVMGDFNELTVGVLTGDLKRAESAVGKTTRRLHAAREHHKSEKAKP